MPCPPTARISSTFFVQWTEGKPKPGGGTPPTPTPTPGDSIPPLGDTVSPRKEKRCPGAQRGQRGSAERRARSTVPSCDLSAHLPPRSSHTQRMPPGEAAAQRGLETCPRRHSPLPLLYLERGGALAAPGLTSTAQGRQGSGFRVTFWRALGCHVGAPILRLHLAAPGVERSGFCLRSLCLPSGSSVSLLALGNALVQGGHATV